jgi:hypothetical protein
LELSLLLVGSGLVIEGRSSVSGFEQERDRWFDDFLQFHEGKLDGHLEALISEPGQIIALLHTSATDDPSGSTILPYLFTAYERLRFDHQYSYAVYKLRKFTDRPVWHFLTWPAVRQSALLSDLASLSVVGAIMCAMALVYCHLFGVREEVQLYTRIGAIVSALVGAALRTIQEGLALDQEIERYSDYRSRTFQLRDRFSRTTDVRERIHLMTELELAAVDELRGFLRTHHNARFVFQ